MMKNIIQNKLVLILIVLLLTSFATIGVLKQMYSSEKAERIRTESNQNSLLDSVTHYQTESGKNAATVGALNLKVNDLEKYRANDAATINDLHLKIKRVQSISNTSTTTKTEIKTVFKDRIVEVHIPGTDIVSHDTLRCLKYITPYLTLDGCVNQHNEFVGLLESRDTLTQVVHRIPRKFLFIKWGTKAIRQEVFSLNPDTYIDFAEYIELKKHKR